jgi:hypothetical protein
LSIDDKAIEFNKNATIQKRNFAPTYANVEPLLNEIQKKLDELLLK